MMAVLSRVKNVFPTSLDLIILSSLHRPGSDNLTGGSAASSEFTLTSSTPSARMYPGGALSDQEQDEDLLLKSGYPGLVSQP